MQTYDPLNAPEPDEWLGTDEAERISLVMAQHRKAGVQLPNEQAHAVIHVIVENQVAMHDEVPTRAALERLMREGLDRHEAVHAVGGVLIEHMSELLSQDDTASDPNQRLFEKLEKLTAADALGRSR